MPETPYVWIDMEKTRGNISAMAQTAAAYGVRLRPHVKTHKLPSLARKQLEAGASGITVAKLSEAEVMAAGGIDDIFIAYPIVTPSKADRAARLIKTIKLIVGVDSYEGAEVLSQAAARNGIPMNVRLEIDIGFKRTGVAYDDAAALARRIHELSHLNLTGIYTFRGASIGGKPTMDFERAGLEEGELMVKLAKQMRAEGLPIADVSVGSTPTGPYAARVEGVTEIRPGTYVFQDRMQASLGVCSLADCAAAVVVTVVSRPSPDRCVVDGGSKTFATDVQPGTAPLNLQGFGHIVEAPDAVLERLSEEHGVVLLPPDSPIRVGDRLHIIPNHICSTVNLHNYVYIADGERMEQLPVAARGMLE